MDTQSQPRKLNRLPCSLQELRETEAEIMKIFADEDLDGEEAKRTVRRISNTFNFQRQAVRAQNYLAKVGAVELVDNKEREVG